MEKFHGAPANQCDVCGELLKKKRPRKFSTQARKLAKVSVEEIPPGFTSSSILIFSDYPEITQSMLDKYFCAPVPMMRARRTSSRMRRKTSVAVVALSIVVEIPAVLVEIKTLLCFRVTAPQLAATLERW